MKELAPGDRVRFREGSSLPNEWKLPADAIGTIVRVHLERHALRRWVDVDFGADVGFLFAIDPAEFEVISNPPK